LPRSFGERAKLDIHRVSPVYEHGPCDSRKGRAAHAVILVHGARTEGVASFDLQYPKAPQALHDEGGDERAFDSERSEYSLMESRARAGIEAFAVNLLGYGLSSRFELDDACSTNQSDQLRLLASATGQPLFEVCSLPPDARHFTNTAAAIQQLGAVVDHVLEKVDVEKGSLFAWSRGGNVTGVYTSLDPSKVESLVLLASEFDFAGNPALGSHRG
jgi:pimeloyl-ACP methyl ester carboxylesterase